MSQQIEKKSFNHLFNKIALYAIFTLLVVLFASIFFFVKNDKEERLINLGDHVIEKFRTGLDYEKVDLLSLSMALAEDGELKSALIADNETMGYQILSSLSERFKKYTHLKSLRIQVLTPEFFIFARSWNEGFEGMPLWWFRDDLDELRHNNEPKVGMETGRLLTFKATIPITSAGKLVGYLEVIKIIDEFAFKLRKKGIELFTLMDEKHLENAELMQDFPMVHDCVISNQNFNQQLLPKIEMLNWDDLLIKNYVYKEGLLFLNEPMYNGKGEQIGLYLLVVSDDALKRFETETEEVSFFTQFSDEDIKKVVNAWGNPHGSFRNSYDKKLIEILPKLRQEDKIELEREAKSILKNYSKEELIDMVLSQKHKEIKVGEVK